MCATSISSWGNVIRAEPFSKLTKLPFRHDGDVAERPNALVLKTSVGKLTAGSNPAASASGDTGGACFYFRRHRFLSQVLAIVFMCNTLGKKGKNSPGITLGDGALGF